MVKGKFIDFRNNKNKVNQKPFHIILNRFHEIFYF